MGGASYHGGDTVGSRYWSSSACQCRLHGSVGCWKHFQVGGTAFLAHVFGLSTLSTCGSYEDMHYDTTVGVGVDAPLAGHGIASVSSH